MGHLDTIENAAQRLISLCQKEKQTKTDKEKMLVIHAEILTSIENLAECDACGAISELIVTMSLADVQRRSCVRSVVSNHLRQGKFNLPDRRQLANVPLVQKRHLLHRKPQNLNPDETVPSGKHLLKNQSPPPHYIPA